MDPSHWFILIVLGGLMGTIGQGIRVVVGLKKLQEKTSDMRGSFAKNFQTNTLCVSLLIGFIAGAMAILSLGDQAQMPSRELLLGVMAAGYSGTDFIEGFVKKYLPGQGGARGGMREPDADPEGAPPPAVG